MTVFGVEAKPVDRNQCARCKGKLTTLNDRLKVTTLYESCYAAARSVTRDNRVEIMTFLMTELPLHVTFSSLLVLPGLLQRPLSYDDIVKTVDLHLDSSC